MDSLDFDNVKILYDSNKVNQKICKKKDKQVTTAVILLVIIMFLSCGYISIIISSFTIEDAGVFFLIFFITLLSCMGVLLYFIIHMIYRKVIPSYYFMEWIFCVKKIQAGWYNDKMLIKVWQQSGVDYYNLHSFLNCIQNKLIITDNSDKTHPICLYIDVTEDNQTKVLIENR